MFRYEIPKKVLVDILCGEDVARGRVRLFYQSLEARLELRSLEIPNLKSNPATPVANMDA